MFFTDADMVKDGECNEEGEREEKGERWEEGEGKGEGEEGREAGMEEIKAVFESTLQAQADSSRGKLCDVDES